MKIGNSSIFAPRYDVIWVKAPKWRQAYNLTTKWTGKYFLREIWWWYLFYKNLYFPYFLMTSISWVKKWMSPWNFLSNIVLSDHFQLSTAFFVVFGAFTTMTSNLASRIWKINISIEFLVKNNVYRWNLSNFPSILL